MVIRSALMYEGKQHLQFFAGIDAETVGARNICMHLQTIPASGSCRAHKHDHHETAIYVIKGAVGAWYGGSMKRQASRSTARAAYAAWTAAKAARESPPLQDEEHVKSPPVRRTCP
ncbi:hypothetical protein [Nonomuraea sp. NPDC049750]|uniref:hypothetical protein n=1 Tax=Nonomuraea sp. NPDC049750 TaxID=3154738 RepID=UPI0034070ED9